MRGAVKGVQPPYAHALVRPDKRLSLFRLRKQTQRATGRRFFMTVAMEPVKLRECRLRRQPLQ
ncbi:hypothetical protein D3C80_1791930 [compost metagenome]